MDAQVLEATRSLPAGPMQAVEVACLVCGTHEHETVCRSSEIALQREYLRRFHTRRLRPGPDGRISESALADRAEFSQDYATDIVRCRACGLVYRNPRPTQEAVTRRYRQDQYGRSRLEAAYMAQRDLFRVKTHRFGRWLEGTTMPRVVEVGSFVGGFLTVGQERGWDMLGVDPGEEVTAFCKGLGLPVYRGTLSESGLPLQSADAVAIWNTFDQLPDPTPTLIAVRAILRPGGMLVVRIPNGACFQWAETQMVRLPRPFRGWLRAVMVWNNLLTFPYLYGYSLPTLDRLMARHGMQRMAEYPDTVVRLADRQTRWWAIQEERLMKWIWSAMAHAETRRSAVTRHRAPWLDVYYRFTNTANTDG